MVSIGFYITKNSLSCAELTLSPRPKIQYCEEFFFENPNSQEEKQLVLSRQMERIENKYKGQSLRFCYGLNQNKVTSFLIEFPFKEKFKILKTLPFEIEDKTPFSSDKVCFDARLCQITERNKSYALCFVTPKETIYKFIEFNKTLNKAPYLLSCSAVALANLLENWNKPLSQTQNSDMDSLYIYLGAENSQLLFYKEGHLKHVSVLDWASSGIVEEMEKLYKLSKVKAWEEFFAKSFILTSVKGWTKEQVFFSNLIKKHIQLLVPKLKLLKMSLETQKNTSITTGKIFGPGAAIKNLTAFLSAELAVNMSRLKSFTHFPEFDLMAKPSVEIALGLALEGLKSSPYSGLNFLRSEKKESALLYSKKWQRAGLIFFLCFLIGTVYSFARKRESFNILSQMQEVFLDYGQKIAYLKESQVQEESIKDFLKSEKAKIKQERIVKEELSRPGPMDQLKLIVEKIGPAEKWDLKIHYLKIFERKVEIRGWVKSLSLQNFKSQLQSLAQTPIEEKQLENSQTKEKSLTVEEKKTAGLKKPAPQKAGEGKKKSQGAPYLTAPQQEKKDQVFFSYSFQLKESL